jgi:hypothetical protein
MKKIFPRSFLILTRSCLSVVWVLCMVMTSLTRAADLAEEWGWFPERAGIMAAESWGIMPQWQGRTLLESYQFQRNVFAPVVMIRMAAAEPELLPELPPLTSVPAVPAGFCEIVGEVSDEKLEPVKGAVVEIVGTGKTAETDSKGAFSFAAVAAGNLTLKASKLGYSSDSQTATGMPGQKLSIRMMLRVKAVDAASDETTLDEETVVGEYQESESGNGMLLDVQSTPVVASSITSADFGKVGANDAASAIGKVAGANIVGGNSRWFVVLRIVMSRLSSTVRRSHRPTRQEKPFNWTFFLRMLCRELMSIKPIIRGCQGTSEAERSASTL